MLLRLFLGLALQALVSTAADGPLCSSPNAQSNIIFIDIPETFPINTSLTRLNITGNDSAIALAMMSPSAYAEFVPSTRDLISLKAYNVTGDTTMRVYVNLSCTVRPSGPVTTLQIIIQVTDMNNNPPYFANLPYSVNISERTAVNTTVYQGVVANDPDPCDQGYLRFSVPDDGNPFASYFSFPVWSIGKLVLMKKLDYETVQRINLTIIVMDNGNNITIMGQLQPQHTATTSVMINIVPGDDYNPAFDQSTYNGVIMDNTPQGRIVSLVPPIAASIKYARPGEEIAYSIVQDTSNADASNFVINNETGVIMTSSVNYLGASQFAFQVQATKVNETYRYGAALVRLNVVRSAQPLTFTQRTYSAAVDDDTPNGTLVATVALIDGGQQRPIYSFDEQVTDFTINSRTGEIRTARMLNYKANPLYNLSVLAEDLNYNATCLVILTISKANRNNPQFSQSIYRFNVSTASNNVGLVVAVDADPGTVVTYHLIDMSGSFAVDGSGHLTYTASSFFTNSSSSLSLMVVAEDDRLPPRQDSALVVVSWATSGVPEVPVPVPLCASTGVSRSFYIGVIVLGIIAGILLLLVILLAICLCKRGRSKATPPPPRVTIEVDRSPQKPQQPSSQGSARKVVGGFEVTKEYGPYVPYDPGESTDDIAVFPSSSVLSSNDKIQKLRIYHSVPTDRADHRNPTSPPTAVPEPRSGSQQSSKKPPAHPPYSSASISTTSSHPSSRVERYKFEEDPMPVVHPSGSARPPRSVSPTRRTYQTPVPAVPHNSAPGPRRNGGRLQATVAALRDSTSGDTSSTETLVTPVSSRAKASSVSFVDNPTGYMSSQEGMDVSMSALTRADGEAGIIVYY